jgi:hypothetical protein
MALREYFEKHKGHGVLASADSEGRVDVAIYAKPYIVDDKTIALIMADRLTRKNLLSNPHAAYLFMELGEGYNGKRLFLTMTKEFKGEEITDPVLNEKYREASREYSQETLSVVFFRVDRELALVGE